MKRAVWDSKSSRNFDTDFDCYIAEALLSEGRSFGPMVETILRYKVKTLTELAEKQKKRFEEYPKLSSLFHEIEMPLAGVLSKMEQKVKKA